ncbi:hypothetical protein EXIGLDRAFT_587720, partial [Exidia glandulosa HHB12029]
KVWDFVLTLREEVRWIWGSSWGLGKILFLLGRYMTWAEVILAVCLILILRTWAIWKRSRRVLCGLLIIF